MYILVGTVNANFLSVCIYNEIPCIPVGASHDAVLTRHEKLGFFFFFNLNPQVHWIQALFNFCGRYAVSETLLIMSITTKNFYTFWSLEIINFSQCLMKMINLLAFFFFFSVLQLASECSVWMFLLL